MKEGKKKVEKVKHEETFPTLKYIKKKSAHSLSSAWSPYAKWSLLLVMFGLHLVRGPSGFKNAFSRNRTMEARVDHSKAFLCTTCGWGFFCFGAIYLQGLN